jgi:hypothetical protein
MPFTQHLEPAVSVLGAIVFPGEHVTLVTIAGGLLIRPSGTW